MSSQTYRLSIEVISESAKNQLSNLKKALQDLEKGATETEKDLTKLSKETSKAGAESDKAKNKQKEFAKALNDTEKNASGLSGKISSLRGAFGALAGVAGTLATTFGIAAIIETQREFDVLNSQLITATGSTEKASEAFASLQEFASKTPYGLAQSVEGFAKLKNLGLDPSIESLTSFGNTASAMGKDLNQMIEAVADASTGEFERLKEFGIKAKSQGNQVSLTFQGVTKTIGKNAKEIQQYLLDIGNVNFAGAMEERAKTLDGRISALVDSWDMFKLSLSQGGIGEIIGQGVDIATLALDGLTEKLQDPATVERFQSVIKMLSAAFGELKTAVESIGDFLAPISDFIANNSELMIALSSGLMAGATAYYVITTAMGVFATVSTAVATAGGLAAMATTALGTAVAFLTSPITLTAAAIAALVAVGVALYKNWDIIKARAEEIFKGLPAPVQEMARNIKSIYEGLSSFLGKAFEFLTPIWTAQFGYVKAIITGAFDFIKGYVSTWINVVGALFKTGVNIFASVFNAGFALVKNIFTTTFNVIKSLVRGDMNGVRQAFKDGFDRAVQIAKKAKDDIVGALRDLGKRLIQMGRDAIQGLINGMGEKIGAAVAKAQELAGKVIGAVKGAFDIHSPSRVMKALGGYAGEGFALGLGEKVKDAKQAAQDLANAVTSTISELHKNHFMLQNHANPLAELDYKLQFGELADLTDKQKTRIKELAKANLDLAKSNDALTSFTNSMADLDKQLALLGVNDPIKQLEYDLANSEKYAGYTTEQLDKLKSKMLELEQAKALQGFNSELEKATTEMQKQEYLLKNIGDKYASMKFDLAQKGYSSEQIGQMVGVQNRTDTITAFGNLQQNLQKGTAFTLPTINSGQGLQGAGNALASGISGMANLDKQYQEQLEIIKNARQAQLDINADYDQQELDLKAAHEAAKRELTLSSAEGVASGLASATKSMFGEQSKAYRAMFAMEQGVAIARSVMAIQQAIAFASANPFPMNLGAMATVAAQTMGIVAKIKALRNPVVGQAHDGIMSVPKSGTWNLEKGERVLPRHTAKALDDKLNSMGNGRAVNVIIHNHTGEKVQQTTDSNGDIRVIIGQELAKQLPQHVNNPNSEFNKSLKNNYQLQRRL